MALILTMLRARRAQAVTLFLLAAVAVAASVAGPVATRATNAAVARLAAEHASDGERAISIAAFTDPTSSQDSARLDEYAGVVSLPGFEVTRSGEIMSYGPTADAATVQTVTETRLLFRERLCEHLTIVDGRCLVGAREILVGEQTAQRRGLRPGDVATMQAARFADQGNLVPDGPPAEVTVAGIYGGVDENDGYWGDRFFVTRTDGSQNEPVFTTRTTMALIGHTTGTSYLDSVAPPSALTPDRLVELGSEFDRIEENLSTVENLTVGSGLPRLAERVATSRELASQLGPVAFIPLTAISLFVIYLAVGYGVFGRRSEIGLVALRGLSRPRRWLLAAGEAVVPILAGAPVGYIVGHLGIGLLARVRLGSSDGAELSFDSVRYAAVALGAALLVALLGQRRALAQPVVDLLRGVPRRAPVWQAITVEAVAVALAVAGTIQLRASPDGLSGLGLLVPGLVVVAVALIAARAFVPLTGLVARRALRRGFLGAGLAAVQMARRPGSQRLFVLLAVGTAMLSFVAAGTDVAALAREQRATVTIGAPRVLRIQGADVRDLLDATHRVDPDGAWAMAAVVIPSDRFGTDAVLALDTPRLAAVASWRPDFGTGAAAVAAALAPPSPSDPDYAPPMMFQGDSMQVDVEVQIDTGGGTRPANAGLPDLELELIGAVGNRVLVLLHDLPVGRQTVTAEVRGCDDGCRLVGLSIPDADAAIRLILHSVRQLDPPADVVSPEALADVTRWRGSRSTFVTPRPTGLSIRMQGVEFGSTGVRVGVVDAPTPVPVAGAHTVAVIALSSVDEESVTARQDLSLSMLPRLGTHGVLVDLGYLERTLLETPSVMPSEVWLGAAAPPDAAQQLRDAGLVVLGGSDVASTRAALDIEGPALALQFHVAAAVLGMLLALGGLGLVAAVDRRARAGDLRVLRVQGLRRRVVRRAALWGYLSTVVLGAVAGLVGAGVAWVAAGDRLPIFVDSSSVLAPPRWPGVWAVAGPWGVAVVALVLGAVVGSWVLRRAVLRPNGNGGAR